MCIIMLETVVSSKFKIIKKLGINPFYQVFKGIHLKNQTSVAIKIEKRSVSESKLGNEARIIKDIQGEQAVYLGIPRVVQFGSETNFNYLILELYGPSLDNLMFERGGKLQLSFSLDLARQMIERIQLVHERGYVHRDLRPQHFLYGRENRPSKLFLSGFGIAKKYLRSDGRHQIYKDSRDSFAGTARYCSINTQMGVQQARRDDIESIFYILIYLIRGYLPWQGVKGKDRKDKLEKIMLVKVTTPIQTLCKDLPIQICECLTYVRTLEYEDKPNYQLLIGKLKNAEELLQKTVLQV